MKTLTKNGNFIAMKGTFSTNSLNFQILFNIFGLMFILLTSIGLWSCLDEIDRLKQSTNNFVKTLDTLKVVDTRDFNSLRTLVKRDVRAAKKADKSGKQGPGKGSVRKRNAYPVHLDPLEPKHQDSLEFCYSIITEKCGSSVPGAPASVGPPGPPGSPGQKGDRGNPGIMGHMGPPGVDGLKGQKGLRGAGGRIGERGSDGPRGPPGLPGIHGTRGINGRRGKRGAPGKDGIKGDKGDPGPRGPPGGEGQKGERGDRGVIVSSGGQNCTCTGIKGQKGQRGDIGFFGYKGEKGQRQMGFTGPTGPPGPKGEKGDAGYCSVTNCGENYMQSKAEQQGEPYSFQEETTTTTTTTTTTPTTTSTEPPTLEPRTNVCRIKQIGKPLYMRKETTVYGTWLSDPEQQTKIYISRDNYGQFLEEYVNLENLRKGLHTKKYNLTLSRYQGTQHAVYNNSFYFQFVGKPHIVRYDLDLHDVTSAVEIRNSHYNDSVYLYKDSQTYYDISADENGLWVVFGRTWRKSTDMYVMKLDLRTLKIEKVWPLTIPVGTFSNSFIACGILYFVDNLAGDETYIEKAFDLYKDEYLYQDDEHRKLNIRLGIPFHRITMLTFFTDTHNRKNSVLLAWDNTHMVKYPLLF